MLDNVIEDKHFANVMQKNIQNLIIYLFEKDEHFGVLCKIDQITFEPPLPKEISAEFRSMTLFFLAGYTFDTATIVDNNLVFEAGFGTDNFGSIVTVPLLGIVQIIIDETPLLINLANYKKEKKAVKKVDNGGVENSMASFLSNPENSKFLKK
ncbi:MAG: hypothetical protein A3E21_06255 [Sulfurimonas sp. RIFCSPHIGHO2_12_FULL_36_9]|uniref:hypothetical protein n=1 Tax=unclassified Sulfurimonas TaxID=2623549 RepID=UPI0008C00803|nr:MULTISPECIES: hypothetical protein [unclassified Sulfurimonas]OHD98605.1 MAG: hypothetical protein A3E21_06255 [Sulfurimonas sp. RIFCSPHIGHO2_12_FULL_36_9]OHE00910.1 MAG: hypothetical protein A3J26_02785 [Sulfurimonas sp. RIFCSPLOWO2_02_FULL_36_28]OHE00941.1 MAG: hypothetical protein A2W82_01945 [Sulfurimonas sp. RIFCSPLOWO2_12_36_12]OHE06911.1 MAG: hypothetical protein A3K14_03865 [Sulfurimonas sp. RIFCSPLOWO2_12_FULL_36_74]